MWDKKRFMKPLLWDISKLMLPLKFVANYQNLSWKKKYLVKIKSYPKIFFGKLHIAWFILVFCSVVTCYIVRKGKSASYVDFFAILPDFTWFFLLGDLRLHSCWIYCDETGIKSMIIIINNITIVYYIHIPTINWKIVCYHKHSLPPTQIVHIHEKIF